ncbi:DUF6417 family protein [Streptomyces sp. NPDC021093]|uniref:DUF6417 family protein n=1 Tax=Streptomyces sp. NPDC021093 TaxID=3365112 RepID=UPI0037B38D5F
MTLPNPAPLAHSIPCQNIAPRLALFTLPEAHDLLRLLQLVADGDDELAEEARWFIQQLDARIPPED